MTVVIAVESPPSSRPFTHDVQTSAPLDNCTTLERVPSGPLQP